MPEYPYKTLKLFRYQVNALFGESALIKNSLPSKIIEKEDGSFELLTSEDSYLKALKIIDELDLDDTLVDEASDGYIDRLEDKSAQRLNPFFWLDGGLNGNKIFDKQNYKFLGPAFLLFGLVLSYFELSNLQHSNFDFSELFRIIFSLIAISAGIKMTIRLFQS